jgi:uncharacterized RDD family membrane protein YckC
VIGDASGGRRQPTPWRIAPVSQRMLAGLVEGGVLALVGLWGSGIRRRRGVERRRGSSVLPVALDAAYRIGLTALAGNTLGQVTVRIRVVHQDPGTVPTWRQAALRWAVAAPPALAPGLVPMPRSAKRWMSRAEQLQPRIEELHRKHGHDRQRFNEELLALYQGEGLSPAAGCLAVLPQVMVSLVYVCAVYLPVLRPPLHQGLHDRVAHTVVVQRTRDREPVRGRNELRSVAAHPGGPAALVALGVGQHPPRRRVLVSHQVAASRDRRRHMRLGLIVPHLDVGRGCDCAVGAARRSAGNQNDAPVEQQALRDLQHTRRTRPGRAWARNGLQQL